VDNRICRKYGADEKLTGQMPDTVKCPYLEYHNLKQDASSFAIESAKSLFLY
jgi:hypothetical protein